MVVSSLNGPGALTRVQIFKHSTRDRILDLGDMLNLEARRSKVSLQLVEFDETFKAVARVRHFVDVDDFKLVCYDILTERFVEWTDHKGTVGEDGARARTLTIRRDESLRQPFVFKIDNGEGEAMPGGSVRMVRPTESLTILLSDFDARKLAQSVLDYIRDWETVHFRRRQEANTIILPPLEPAPAPEPTPAPEEPAPRKRSRGAARAA